MSKVFYGGVPTDLDVRRIVDALGIPKVGDLIRYETISDLLKTEKGSSRWSSVTNAWRKRMEHDHGLFIGTDPGVGFVVLDEHGKVGLGRRKYKQGSKALRRSVHVYARVDSKELTDAERQECQKNADVAQFMLKARLEKMKDLSMRLPAAVSGRP